MKRKSLIFPILVMTTMLFSCQSIDIVEEGRQPTLAPCAEISAVSSSATAVGRLTDREKSFTKAMVSQTSTSSFIKGNFIKVDETAPAGEDWTQESQYDMTRTVKRGFEDAQIVEAEVFSSPDNTAGYNFRSIVFNPRMIYNYTPLDAVFDPEVAFVSRMVGWYPMTYEVPDGLGDEKANALFSASNSMKIINGKVCVEFKNKLDGQTDIMMSDMREGRMYKEGFKHTPGPDVDVQPYGHYFSDPLNQNSMVYHNYFTFNHYLTCIRVSLTSSGGSLNDISWRTLNNIVVCDQPSTVTIALPVEQRRDGSKTADIDGTTASLPCEDVAPIFGEVVSWADSKDFGLIRTPMFELDPPYEEWGYESPLPYNLPRVGVLPSEGVYVGYALVRPEQDTNLQLFTDAGTYNVTIPKTVKVDDEDVDILKAGYVYDVCVNVNSVGVLDVVVKNDDADKFRDLTPYNETYGDYESANCYLITPSLVKMDENQDYDGFFFRPNVPGRGPKGDIAGDPYEENFEFEPHTVKIISQIPSPSSSGGQAALPLEHVELVQGYVRFSLNLNSTSSSLVEGNAIIGLYDENDNIIWSWHVWVCDEVKDISLNGTTFMDRNLGAVFAPEDANAVQTTNALETYGLYYQWGRKDPTPGPESYNYSLYDMRTAQYYTLDGIRDDVAEVYMVGEAPTIADAVASPTVILAPSTPYFDPEQAIVYNEDWLYMKNDDLWGGISDKKTIYDPCPYGYKVPKTELRDMFKAITPNVGSVGLYYDTDDGFMYFPYAGCKGDDVNRGSRTHAWFWCGHAGDYMDAEIHDNGYRGRSMLSKDVTSVKLTGDVYNLYNTGFNDYTTKSGQPVYGTKRGVAASVRCIRYAGEP